MTAGGVVETPRWTDTGLEIEHALADAGTVNELRSMKWGQFRRLNQVPCRPSQHVDLARTGDSLLDTRRKNAGWDVTELVVVLPPRAGGGPSQPSQSETEIHPVPSIQVHKFPESLDDICIKARLTREQLGQLLGVKRRTVQSWVSGQRVPKKETQESLDRLRAVIEPVFSWTGSDVQKWMHSGDPSGFDLLMKRDYATFRDRVAKASSRRHVVPAEVQYISGPRANEVDPEASVEEVVLAPKDLLNDWLSDVRRQASVPRRRSSGWFPEGYEPARGPEGD